MSVSRYEELENKMPLVLECVDKGRDPEECAQKILAGDPTLQTLSSDEESSIALKGSQEAEREIKRTVEKTIVEAKRRLSTAYQNFLSNPIPDNRIAYETIDTELRLYQSPEYYAHIKQNRFNVIAKEKTALARAELVKANWAEMLSSVISKTRDPRRLEDRILFPWHSPRHSASLNTGVAYLAGIGSQNVSSGAATIDAGYRFHLSPDLALELGGGILVDLGATTLSYMVGSQSHAAPDNLSVGSSYVDSEKTDFIYSRDPISAGPRLGLRYKAYHPTIALRVFNGSAQNMLTKGTTTLTKEEPVTITTSGSSGGGPLSPLGCIVIPFLGCFLDGTIGGGSSSSSHQEIRRTFSNQTSVSHQDMGSHVGYAVDISPLSFSWSVVSLDVGLSIMKDPSLSKDMLYGFRFGASGNLDAIYEYLSWI